MIEERPGRSLVLFVALSVIWGLPYLFIRVAVRELTPATLVFLRTAVGGALLIPLVARRGQLRALLPHWRAVALYTVAEVAVPWVLLSDAERRLPSSLAGLLVAAVPLVGVGVSALSGGPGHERLAGRRLAGLLVGLLGVAVLLGLDVRTGDLGAVAEMAVVVVGYSIGPIIVARRLRDVPAMGVVAASLVLTALVYAPFAIVQFPRAMPSAQVIVAVAILAVFCTALAFVIFFRLIAAVGPVRATIVAFFNPAVAVALGVALLGEPFTIGTGAGFVLILLGSWLATRPARLRAAPSAADAEPTP
ncbi:MAG TPA: EamA family transporter [Anaeromyxobacter sp.]|nr:EamA family transporter [Anaeromyxobacter sp.]